VRTVDIQSCHDIVFGYSSSSDSFRSVKCTESILQALQTMALAIPICSLSSASRFTGGKQSSDCPEEESVTVGHELKLYTYEGDLYLYLCLGALHGTSDGSSTPRAGQESHAGR
jgi:hypothetical protein